LEPKFVINPTYTQAVPETEHVLSIDATRTAQKNMRPIDLFFSCIVAARTCLQGHALSNDREDKVEVHRLM
jgi:hypothetical protein